MVCVGSGARSLRSVYRSSHGREVEILSLPLNVHDMNSREYFGFGACELDSFLRA